MSAINKIGLLLWFLVILGVNIKLPFSNWRDLTAFLFMLILGSVFLIWDESKPGGVP